MRSLPAWARCDRGRGPCRVRVTLDVDEAGMVPVTYWRWHPDARAYLPDVSPTPTKPNDAVPYSAWCRAHRSPLCGKVVRIHPGSEPCGPACREATGAECRCTCGGENHGADAA